MEQRNSRGAAKLESGDVSGSSVAFYAEVTQKESEGERERERELTELKVILSITKGYCGIC